MALHLLAFDVASLCTPPRRQLQVSIGGEPRTAKDSLWGPSQPFCLFPRPL